MLVVICYFPLYLGNLNHNSLTQRRFPELLYSPAGGSVRQYINIYCTYRFCSVCPIVLRQFGLCVFVHVHVCVHAHMYGMHCMLMYMHATVCERIYSSVSMLRSLVLLLSILTLLYIL